MKHGNLYRIAFEGFLLTFCLVLFLSVLSFDMYDAPSAYAWPHNANTANWCGPVGAFLAYYTLYYLGPGVLLGLAAVAAGLIIHLFGKPVTQPILRLVGLCLVVSAASVTWHLVWPTETIWLYRSGSFPEGGNGGILGIGAAGFLNIHLARLGTWLVVVCCWIVGSILLADTFVFASVRYFGLGMLKALGLAEPAWKAAREHSAALGDIWTRLNEKQKARAQSFNQAVAEYTAQQQPYDTPTQVMDEDEPLEHAEDRSVEEVIGAAPKRKKKGLFKIKKRKPAPKPKKPPVPIQKSYDDYELPPLDFLKEPETGFTAIQSKMVEHKAQSLEAMLDEFGVNAEVVNAEPGPAITMYELELAPGIKVSQISTLANDMARALGSGMVRVVAPLPGKHTIGIEVPNSQREIVRIKDLILKGASSVNKMQIPLFLGKSSSGEALVSDLAAMPHMLIAGTTGSGKSVCINSIITSILLTRRPDEVKLILIDPKMVEMAMFESIPHLMSPIVTEMRRAEQILEWATQKMDERYELLSEAQVRNIASYNLLSQEELIQRFNPSTPEEEAKIPKKLPHIVIIIDELADLMMTSAKEVEAYVVRIAQKSRAIGIHLVLATQRPQATVVTGLIKSNMPSRIAFRVAARMDSRIILDQNGAETLLGQGDMLFLRPGTSELVRAQGAFLDDDEIRGVVKFLKDVALPQFSTELMQLNKVDLSAAKKDDMYEEAVKVVLETQRGSVSLLQRRLGIGYARASRIIEMMGASGLLGEYKGSQAREVVMTLDEYEAMKKEMIADEVAGYADLTQNDEDEEEYDEAAEYIDDDEAIEAEDES
ncbi:MAG: DNA translocase FtsK 4TM domain-containing protein [Phycisphaerae bacterium]|nr:DNA translocase FtsK 4TM domain-containing protein [Phycisphaerae bacterium]